MACRIYFFNTRPSATHAFGREMLDHTWHDQPARSCRLVESRSGHPMSFGRSSSPALMDYLLGAPKEDPNDTARMLRDSAPMRGAKHMFLRSSRCEESPMVLSTRTSAASGRLDGVVSLEKARTGRWPRILRCSPLFVIKKGGGWKYLKRERRDRKLLPLVSDFRRVDQRHKCHSCPPVVNREKRSDHQLVFGRVMRFQLHSDSRGKFPLCS